MSAVEYLTCLMFVSYDTMLISLCLSTYQGGLSEFTWVGDPEI